ncbi:MAG: hypothetical protein MUF21_14625, partial [Gemmatimonadaceae bacterium]|nr:hypothetical protein [Gemmatimonadaceae bacterium]
SLAMPSSAPSATGAHARRLACLLMLGAATVACSDAAAPSVGTPVPLSFQSSEARGADSIPLQVTVDGRTVTVRGHTATPCINAGVTATAGERERDLVLDVRAQTQGEICLTAIGSFRWTAELREVVPGTRRLLVRETQPSLSPPTRVRLDTTIVVR